MRSIGHTQRRRHRILTTSIAPLAIIEDELDGLSMTWLPVNSGRTNASRALEGSRPAPKLRPELVEELRRYFAGEDVDFAGVETPGGGAFERAAWNACRSINHGETCSYAELAARSGWPCSAARAAGGAMRRNRLPIVIPCHRVVSASGALHGYGGSVCPTGEQLRIKRSLLRLEGALLAGGKAGRIRAERSILAGSAAP